MNSNDAIGDAFEDGMDEFDGAMLKVGHDAAERIGAETGRADIAVALKQMMDAASAKGHEEATPFEKEVGKLLDEYLTNGITSREFVTAYDQLAR